jgi:ketol-acid reductoisomerase
MNAMFHETGVDVSPLLRSRVAIVDYGSQGHAHPLNLRDSGIDVRVGVRPDGHGWRTAQKAGFEPVLPAAAAAWADVVAFLVPDLEQPRLYSESIAPHLAAGKTLLFAHGFTIRFGWIRAATGSRRRAGGPQGARSASPRTVRACLRQGPRRAAMRELLAEIRSGTYAEQLAADKRAGLPAFESARMARRLHPLELVGAELRRRMPFIVPVDGPVPVGHP